MKYFFGCTFMNQEELQSIGTKYPIKLDYYKTKSNDENIKSESKYGIEVVKTSYIEKNINVEKRSLPDIVKDEFLIEKILNILKKYKVTPVSAEYVIEDLLKAE